MGEIFLYPFLSSCGGTNNKIDTRQSNRRKETGFNSCIRYHRNGDTRSGYKSRQLLLFLDKAIIHFEELTGQRNLSFGVQSVNNQNRVWAWNSKWQKWQVCLYRFLGPLPLSLVIKVSFYFQMLGVHLFHERFIPCF